MPRIGDEAKMVIAKDGKGDKHRVYEKQLELYREMIGKLMMQKYP